MTEKERMLAGEIYDPSDKELADRRTLAHKLCKLYNDTFDTEEEKRKEIMDELFPTHKAGAYVQGPVYVDYGCFTNIGKNFYANFNLTILDICPVNIGDDVLMGPNVSIVTPLHPMCYEERNMRFRPNGEVYDYEYGKPITIGNNCWIASNVTIIGGVTIGDGSVIGAGSVVTKDIPAGSLAYGNPCRVIRQITEDDLMHFVRY